MAILVLPKIGFEKWTRPDQGHLTNKDINQLRKLVEAPAPQQSSQSGRPRVVLDFEQSHITSVIQVRHLHLLQICTFAHRAELEHAESLAAETRPFLKEERRAGRIETNGDCDEDEQGGQQEQQQSADDDVDDTL